MTSGLKSPHRTFVTHNQKTASKGGLVGHDKGGSGKKAPGSLPRIALAYFSSLSASTLRPIFRNREA